jgi:ATP-dependent helicase/nuclease subunit B
VLVPFAQLMPVATRQWAATFPDGFAPRFETTRDWARQLAPFRPGPDDLSFDPARDLPLAQSLLERAGLGAQREVLAAALMESALQLASLAAARAPDERLAWAAEMTPLLAGAETGPLAFEAAVARLALVWAATSAQATDLLFSAQALDAVDAVLVLQGFQPEPLTSALATRWGERAETLALPAEGPARATCVCSRRWTPRTKPNAPPPACWPTSRQAVCPWPWPPPTAPLDPAACARCWGRAAWRFAMKTAGSSPPPRVAAQLMALLRALARNASSDDVLDALKNAPSWGVNPPARRWSPGCAARACATGAMSSACAAPTAWMPKPLRLRRWWPRWLPPAPASARPGRWPPGSTSCATCC